MCRLPLCTPNVKPTMSGVIVERRDQVLITCGRWPPARTRSTILRMPLSIQGPFLTERGISKFAHSFIASLIQWINESMSQSFHSAIANDHLLRALVLARLVTARRLAPGRHRIASGGSLAFIAAVRVVHRIHRHTAHVRTNSFPTRPACLTQRNIFVLDIADLAHGSAALNRHPPHFTDRKSN